MQIQDSSDLKTSLDMLDMEIATRNRGLGQHVNDSAKLAQAVSDIRELQALRVRFVEVIEAIQPVEPTSR